MATTVTSAFEEFLRNTVNLDSEQSKKARSSRDWLVGQVHEFPNVYPNFPALHNPFDIAFGSFARRTKIRPLDDIDQIIGLMGDGAWYTDLGSYQTITVPEESVSNLRHFLHDNSRLLNSRRVLNAFKVAAKVVPQYDKADIERDGEVVRIGLKSYEWSFDLVPGFMTVADLSGRTYYLIPDGNGHWKKTDPRMDRDRVEEVNSAHNGRVLNAIRIMKFWNARRTAPEAPSYIFENLILNYYQSATNTASQFVDLEVVKLLPHIATGILGAVQDPKRIQGDLNTLDWNTRFKISQRASHDSKVADEARRLETNNDHKGSINKWREVFGPEFPEYG